MLNAEYLEVMEKRVLEREDQPNFDVYLKWYAKELNIMSNLNLDSVLPDLKKLYDPVERRRPRDATCMLRSLILMTLCKCKGITQWVNQTKHTEILCILCGFEDLEHIPGVGTYYDFMNRVIDGPYQSSDKDRTLRSQFNARRHIRNFKDEKQQEKDKQNPNQTQSEQLVQELLPHAADNRPDDFYKFLEDLLIKLGIQPAIKQGLITDLKNLTVAGDGSILQTASSARGKPTCDCHENGIYKCEHDKSFTSPTARWCHNHAKDCFEFGDRYYHLVLTQGGS